MDVEKLKWFSKKKKGLRLDNPNDNLASEYIKSSEETLDILQNIEGKSNMWLATTKYYSEYFAVYALLQRIGISSEIHECTIEICKLLEEMKIIPKEYSQILENDKDLRIDNQYYLKNREVNIDMIKLRNFILNLKEKVNTITLDEKNLVRKKIKGIIEQKGL